MLVGIPGSGKSTLAKELSEKENGIILSSDRVRLELFDDETIQTKNKEIFEYISEKTKENLENGHTVIFDATNTNRKKRVHFINTVAKKHKKIVYYIGSSLETAFVFNNERERTVKKEEIEKVYKNLQPPIYGEGWDDIHYVFKDLVTFDRDGKNKIREILEEKIQRNVGYELLIGLANGFQEFKDILELPQDSTFHSFSVSRHIYHVYDYIHKEYVGEDKLVLLWSALFHDTGKYFCKNFLTIKGEPTRYANFRGHENVSAQIAARILSQLGYSTTFILKVVELVQFHMILLNASDKGINRLKKLISLETYKMLEFLNIADREGK